MERLLNGSAVTRCCLIFSLIVPLLVLLLSTNVKALVKTFSDQQVYDNSVVRYEYGKVYAMGLMTDCSLFAMNGTTGDIFNHLETSDFMYHSYFQTSVTPQASGNLNCYFSVRRDSYTKKYLVMRTCFSPKNTNYVFLDTVSDDPIVALFYDSGSLDLYVVTTKGMLGLWHGIFPRTKWYKEFPGLENGAQLMPIISTPKKLLLLTSNGLYVLNYAGEVLNFVNVHLLVNSQKFFMMETNQPTSFYLVGIQQYRDQDYGIVLFDTKNFEFQFSRALLDSKSQSIDMRNCSNILSGTDYFFFICHSTPPVAYQFGLEKTTMHLIEETVIPAKTCSNTVSHNYDVICDTGIYSFYRGFKRTPINIPVSRETQVLLMEKLFIFSNSQYGEPTNLFLEIVDN